MILATPMNQQMALCLVAKVKHDEGQYIFGTKFFNRTEYQLIREYNLTQSISLTNINTLLFILKLIFRCLKYRYCISHLP